MTRAAPWELLTPFDIVNKSPQAQENLFGSNIERKLMSPYSCLNSVVEGEMQNTNLAQGIAENLRRGILRGVYEPGTPLKERELALSMDVSRTPMREAIRILAQHGLVTLRPSRSPVVANPSFTEITDTIEVLVRLEEHAVELACARATPSDLKRICSLHDELVQQREQIEDVDLFALDMTFHNTIVAASHNAALMQAHQPLVERMWRIRFLSARQRQKQQRTFDEHENICHAILARDVTLARTAVRTHMESMIQNIRYMYDLAPGE